MEIDVYDKKFVIKSYDDRLTLIALGEVLAHFDVVIKEVEDDWRSILLQQKQKRRNACIGNVRSVCSSRFQENDSKREKEIWWKGKNKSVHKERD